MYADDVQLYTSYSLYNLNDGISNMNSDLKKYGSGHQVTGLTPSKSKSILITRHKLDHICIPRVEMNGSCIDLVDQVKNLDIIFTQDLSWSAYINSAVGKVYGMLRT